MKIEQMILPKSGYGNKDCTLTAYLQEQCDYQPELLRPAVLICPGGGYRFISSREAQPIALAFLNEGYQAFVLDYTILDDHETQPLFPSPFIDLAQAMATIRMNASSYLVDSNKITLVGFSAGGHLCSVFSSLSSQPEFLELCGYSEKQIHPNSQILAYPVIDLTLGWPEDKTEKEKMGSSTQYEQSQNLVTKATPPTFLWHTQMDKLVPVENSYLYALALVKNQVKHECHIYQEGKHGLALATSRTSQDILKEDRIEHVASWFKLAIEWLEQTHPSNN